MPTRRGWEVVLVALGVMVAGRVLGLVQLYVVGVAGLILLGAAVAWVRLSPARVEVRRRLRPNRVTVGATVEVELSITNTAGRRSPLLEAHDAFGAGRTGTTFAVAPLPPGGTAQATYHLDADARGVFEGGPLEVEVRDPFGLAFTRSKLSSGVPLTVLPRIDVIGPPPRSAGGAAPGGTLRPPFPSQSGDGFYALREYVAGDDLRRVHWASTARRGQLMIRQDDQSVHDRTTLLLDLRAEDPELFEAAVSAAASVLSATSATLVRLVDTAGHDSGYGTGSGHAGALLDRLAAAKAVAPSESISVGMGLVGTGLGGDTMVLVTAVAPDRSALKRLAGLSPRFVQVIVVAVGVEPGGALRTTGALRTAGAVRVIPVGVGQAFASAWNDGLRRARPVGPPARRSGPGRGATV